jgi:Carbohydrate binding domain
MRLLPRFSVCSALMCIGLAGCSDSKTEDTPENLISRNDFESLEGWAPTNPSLTTVKAHSGRYSVKVDSGVEYGISYISPLSKASPTRLQKVQVSAWVMRMGKDANANLVVEVKNPANDAQKIFWESLEIGKETKAVNEWTEVKKTFTLPATIEAAHELRVYLWRAGATQPVFLDDVVISRAE